LLAVAASLNDWRFMVICTRWYCFFGGAMKAFLSFKVEGNGVGFVVHLSRPLCRAYSFRHFYGVVQ
jgi:hypothetical protein